MSGGGAVAVLHDVLKERSELPGGIRGERFHELRTTLTCITGYVDTLLGTGSEYPNARILMIISRTPRVCIV